ncbi:MULTISPECIES: MFS transporter [Erwiniaceae]|uniref:Major facilitator transporter n=1 Tax=Pantoea rwandensis TaxID=1076550 RepID=A0ABM5RG58_9GAMM|nr:MULTISPECIES: MFS transporter [Erwiniaceae]AIR85006.1 major facilitator transporter [Pantoea rwandensis]MBK0089578.1 MFS transporter [Erwinia sp. S59]MBK0124513.1 MFS transporter [Pantoea sp. S61]
MTQPGTKPNHTMLLALLVAVTFFMENLDATVMTTAIPQMARDFTASPVALNVGVSAYLLAVAVGIPTSGWLAERFGARTVFACAILIFTLASVLCGLSDTLPMFTLSRILQGIGGAMMVPVGRMVVLRVTEKKDMVKTIAFITWPGLIAPVLGPPLGGLIVTYGHWPWIFWLNIPLGILAIIATGYLVPQFKAELLRPFDVRGFVLTATACTALIIALEALGQMHLSLGIPLLLAGILCSVMAYRHSFSHPQPLLPFNALTINTFRNAVVGGSFFRASINAVPFLLPLLFQLGFGWSAAQAGAMVLWVFAGNLAMKPATIWLMKRFGFRQVLMVNGVISLAAMLGCLLLSSSLGYFAIAAILFIGGLSRSLQFSCYNSLGFADVPQTKMSDASVVFSIFFQFSMSAGIALAALFLRGSMLWQEHATIEQSDIRIAFAGVALLVLMSLFDVWRLEKNAGAQVLSR